MRVYNPKKIDSIELQLNTVSGGHMAFSERPEGNHETGGEYEIPTIIYHGGITGSISSFHWASHFGTRDQALFSILAKAIRDNHSNIPATPYLYECRHVLQPWGFYPR